jgi:hypothetical protein
VAGRGWGVLGPVGDHVLQEFNTLCPTSFRTPTKLLDHPNKNLEGEGEQDDIFCFGVYIVFFPIPGILWILKNRELDNV